MMHGPIIPLRKGEWGGALRGLTSLNQLPALAPWFASCVHALCSYLCVNASVVYFLTFFPFCWLLLFLSFRLLSLCDGTNFPPMYLSVSQVVLWPIKAFEACWPTTRKSSSKAWDDSLTCIICVSRSVCVRVCVCVCFVGPGRGHPLLTPAVQRSADRPTGTMAAAAFRRIVLFANSPFEVNRLGSSSICFFRFFLHLQEISRRRF